MELKAGKTYKLRNGDIETLAELRYPWLFKGETYKFFYVNGERGHLVAGSESLQHGCDIMEEV